MIRYRSNLRYGMLLACMVIVVLAIRPLAANAWPINAGSGTQQKTGSLLIGDGASVNKLCLNAGAESDPKEKCISAWTDILAFNHPVVILSTNLMDINGSLPVAAPAGVNPDTYTLQTGYINLESSWNSHYTTAIIQSPLPNICNTVTHLCPNGDVTKPCQTNSDCKATGAAVYGIGGDAASNTYAGYFGGTVYVLQATLPNALYGETTATKKGRICLGGFEVPDGDVAGGNCISSWNEVTAQTGEYVKLQSANPPIAQVKIDLSKVGAAVSGSSKFGIAILGDSKCIAKGPTTTCGNGYCDPGGTIAQCGVAVPAESADGTGGTFACPIDCGGVTAPVFNPTNPLVHSNGQATLSIITKPISAIPGNVKVIVTRAIGVPTFQPVDGATYTSGQVVGNTTIVYAGIKLDNNVTFSPPVDTLPGSGAYTYRVYQGNALPRYSQPVALILTVDQLTVATNPYNYARVTDTGGLINCTSGPGCTALYTRGSTATLTATILVVNWVLNYWSGCIPTNALTCNVVFNGDITATVNLRNNNPPPCFTAETPVDTPRGPQAISTLDIGDEVYAYDVVAGRVVTSRVEETFIHQDRAYGRVRLSNGTTLEVTSNHPFFNARTRQWQEIGTMNIGDTVLTRTGNLRPTMTILSLEFTSGLGSVYNIEVDSVHDYYVKGILVHNKCPPLCGDVGGGGGSGGG